MLPNNCIPSLESLNPPDPDLDTIRAAAVTAIRNVDPFRFSASSAALLWTVPESRTWAPAAASPNCWPTNGPATAVHSRRPADCSRCLCGWGEEVDKDLDLDSGIQFSYICFSCGDSSKAPWKTCTIWLKANLSFSRFTKSRRKSGSIFDSELPDRSSLRSCVKLARSPGSMVSSWLRLRSLEMDIFYFNILFKQI